MIALGLFRYVARMGSFAFSRDGEVDLDRGEGSFRARGGEGVALRVSYPSKTAEVGLLGCRAPQVG